MLGLSRHAVSGFEVDDTDMSTGQKHIGPYELLEEIGAGGFGRVYRARHVELDEIRAVKIATDAEFVRQLRREGKLLAQLRHPRIVFIYDLNTAHDPPYIVMECVEGGDLRKRLDQGPLPIEQIVQIMLDVLEALDHAHSHGVIHRDIKPSNILLDKDGRAKVSDFGLGRLVEDLSKSWARVESVRSGSGDTTGTLRYMSPEQLDASLLKGEPLDQRSDLYSLGLVFYEMLVGELPVGTAPELPSEARSGVPAEFDDLFRRLTQGRRERRYQTAQEVTTGLRHVWERAEAERLAREAEEERERQAEETRRRRIEEHDRTARSLLQQERYQEAIAEWERLLAVDSQNQQAKEGIASAREREQQAKEQARRAREEQEREQHIHQLMTQGQALAGQGRYEQAIGVWQKVLALDPQHTGGRQEIAGARRQIGDRERTEAERISDEARRQRWGTDAKWAIGVLALAIVFLSLSHSRHTPLRPQQPDRTLVTRPGPVPASSPRGASAPEQPKKPPSLRPGPSPYKRGHSSAVQAVSQPPHDARVGRVWVNPADGAEMVYVPAGDFSMGSPAGEGESDEHPQRRVYLDAYWIDKTEVTVGQYRRFCEATGRSMPAAPSWGWQENHPVVNVTWEEAVAYARWAGKRLPTEAEWEKAARGTGGRAYPWGDSWDPGKCANGLNLQSTRPVGSYRAGASPYGALDMAGNVYEWCADWYNSNYYASALTRNPQGPGTGQLRVLRGGSWGNQDPTHLRCADRNPHLVPVNRPAARDVCLGLRCVRGPL